MRKPLRLFMLSALLVPLLAGLPASVASQELSPASFLDPDGSLRLDGRSSGALDLAGWQVHLDPLRGPAFAPAATPLPGWNALGSGLNDDVIAIAVSGSDVYAGGYFTNAGGDPNADYIAKWDGSNWSALGSGLNDTVVAIAVGGSGVYVGGEFTNAGGHAEADYIAKWDGSNWSALGPGLNDYVWAIAVSGSDVYVGGVFTDANDPNADYIAKWDGSNWSALGSGLNNWVADIAFSGSSVYAGGWFTDAGGNAKADHIAKWNGSSWLALGPGLNHTVFAIAISGSNVYVGGSFTDAGGNANADHIAKWNGSRWSALGGGLNGNQVRDIAISGGDVYVGGDFTDAGGDASADRIVKWDGSNWSALGSGLNNWVADIAFSGSDVYVGGVFTNAGGNANADHIAFYHPPKIFFSQAAHDGWILESSETSGAGGAKDSTATTFRLGDDASDRQYRAILSFNTASLPNNAIIQSAVLKIKQSGSPVGSSPFNILGNLYADIRQGCFGSSSMLQLADFNAAATATKVGTFGTTPAGGWYTAALNSTGRSNINKTGLTQFRLYFSKDDNDNLGADYMRFVSGNASSGMPQLIVTYTLP